MIFSVYYVRPTLKLLQYTTYRLLSLYLCEVSFANLVLNN